MSYLKVLLPIVMFCCVQASGCQRHSANPERLSLISAVKKDSLRKVQVCLDENQDPNATDSDGTTALHWACYSGAKDAIIQLLLNKGAHIEVQNVDGWTPLHAAVKGQQITAVKRLLKAGANPNSKDYRGNTPLSYACCLTESKRLSEEIMMLLLEYKPDIAIRYQDGLTVLHCAAALNWEKAVKRLLVLQADPNAKDKHGFTPSYYAKRSSILVPLLLHSNS